MHHNIVAAHHDCAGIQTRRAVGGVAHFQDYELPAAPCVLRPKFAQRRPGEASADQVCIVDSCEFCGGFAGLGKVRK